MFEGFLDSQILIFFLNFIEERKNAVLLKENFPQYLNIQFEFQGFKNKGGEWLEFAR